MQDVAIDRQYYGFVTRRIDYAELVLQETSFQSCVFSSGIHQVENCLKGILFGANA